ncbi:Abhydrolase family protein [Polystyrenella longa]|uniref:Abhydrolase family protein n=1 Tax=Polystyrenella longa TaxID=2528007 RepID=A0A518CUE0_9PLAN|nr:alpha/beta hydrolase family protein [Polystyrenella longa]QDU82843.1 Abhydrolase family protein [Polystyrenella longa]
MSGFKRREFISRIGAGAAGMALTGLGPEFLTASNSSYSSEANSLQAAETETHPTFTTDREDGRYESTAGFLQETLKHLKPKLAFDPEMTAEAYPAWQAAVREKLTELLCFPEVADPQPAPKRIWKRKREGYEWQKWEAYPEPYSVVPFYVLVPDGVSANSPAPTVMCFPGSTHTKESLVGECELDTGKRSTWKHFQTNRQALHFVKQGFISVAIENPATGELVSPLSSRSQMANCGLWLGRNYLGISVFQKAKILEWLREQNWVDSNRIATCGHSLGSNPADILGVLYPETVKAVIHNDFVCNWIERAYCTNFNPPGGSHHTVPGLFQWFDHTDIEASLAPRPLLFTEGGRTMQINKIRKAYELNGQPENIEVTYYAKYATADKRLFEEVPIPAGISNEEYFQYVNVDAPQHRFRPDKAVPWLKKVMKN